MSRARAYRVLLFLYPRRFRRAYGAQMLQLFRDQRREYGARAWLTATRDLFATLPIQHLEAFMHLGPQGKLIAAAVATTAGIVAFSIVDVGFAAAILVVLLLWIVLSLLKERGAVASAGLGWKLTLSGMGALALLLVVFAGPWPQEWRDEISGDLAWYVGFSGFVLAIVTFAVGILAALVERFGRRPISQ